MPELNAFGTPFTEARLREEAPLDDRWIVADPDELIATVDALLDEEATEPRDRDPAARS